MSPLQWIQASASLVAIVAAIVGAALFLWRWRRSAIAALRKDLALTWTNEGDITSTEFRFFDLKLQLTHGDLFGSLTSPRRDETYDVHVYPKWFWANAKVSLFKGRTAWPVTEVRLRLKENRNRLHWQVLSKDVPEFLPPKAVLWPSPLQAVQNET